MTPPLEQTPEPADFLAGGGEMGERIRSFDWAATPLGPIESWSPALRTMLAILLANRFPQLLWWGPQYIQFYNDPYRPIPGAKHPHHVLGRPGSECWAEVWHVIGPLVDRPFNGGQAAWDEDIFLEIHRHGFVEETHFTIAYSPVPDQTVPSGIGGVLATVHEITEKVVGERRSLALRDLGARVGEAKTAEEACAGAAKTLAGYDKDVPFALLYLIDAGGKSARLAGAAGVEMGQQISPLKVDLREGQQHGWPLAEPVRLEAMRVVDRLGERFSALPPGPWSDPPNTAVIVPIPSNKAREPAGLMIAGVSARLKFDDYYRDFFDLVKTQVATAIANARAYEQERQRAEALAELDRAKTAFFSNVSHEFRTPLALMLGPLEDTLAAADGLPPEARQRLEVAHRNSLRLLKLVNTLLDFSRIEAGRIEASYEPADLAAFTRELASVFRSAIERAGLRLVVNCPPLSESVYVDREMWEKIVLNLLSNAFKFTFEGEIEVSLRQAGERVELAVRDTGTGIPADELPRVFDRFHRVRTARGRTFEGSGIGLALVEELVQLHGGTVRVQSEVDSGSTFTVTIPLGKGHLPANRIEAPRDLASTGLRGETYVEEALRWLPDEPAQAGGAPALGAAELSTESETSQTAGVPGAKPRILLADDNADMREYVRRLLSRHYDVETAADGLAALRAARDHVPDLVLTDVMMPEMDGYGLLRELRADLLTATVPVILLSARAGEEARVEGMEAGADDYVTKPFSARELLARVSAHLEIARIRRDAQHRVAESEERYRRLVGLLPVAVYTCEAPSGVITFHNGHAAKLWGRAPQPGDSDERFCGSFRLWQPDGTLLPHDQTPMAVTLREGREFRNEEVIIERPDGTRINVLVNINPIRDPSGRITGAINAFQDTTALTRAQELVEEHRRVLELTTSAAQVGTWQWNVKTGDLGWSEIHKKLWGYGPLPDSIAYQDWARLIDKDDLAQAERAIGESLRSGVEYDVEYRVKPLGGTGTRWIRSIGRPVLSESGEAVLMRGVSFDVTARKKAEEDMRESEARFRTLADSSPVLIWVNGLQGCEFVNRAFLDFLAVQSSEVQGFDWSRFVHPEDRDGYRDAYQAAFDSRQSFAAQFRFRRADGEYRWMKSAGVPRLSAAGEFQGFVGSTFDITDIKQAEAAARESEERFRNMADHAPVMIWVTEASGACTYLSKSWYEFTGQTEATGLGLAWLDAVHPDDRGQSQKIFLEATDRREAFKLEYRLRRNDGVYRWAIDSARPRYGPGGEFRGYVGSCIDITERKQLEQGLQEADRRKDEFLAMLGHELRNPLAAITSGTTLLQSNLNPERRIWVEQMMARQVEQLRRLVDDLLDVTRITQGKIQLRKDSIELTTLVTAAVESVRELTKARRHELSVSLPAEPVQLLADPARIEQVLVNLLTNAAKYTPEKGQISLSAERLDNEVTIRCRDNGVGISQEMLHQVFEPFVQINPNLDRSVSGLGMGLTLVKRLTEMHGGSVTALSAGLGKGSEFVLRLPALPSGQTVSAAKPAEEPDHTTASRPLAVLVIDDNRDLAESLAIFLRGTGHRVGVAHDGESGSARVERERPDAVLLDLGLPGMDGYAVAEQIRATPALKDTVVIAISGYRPLDDERTKRARFDAHLVKPIEYGQLLSVLERKLAQRKSGRTARARRILLIEDNEQVALLTAELLRSRGQQVLIALNGEDALQKADGFRPEIVLCDLNLPGKNGFETARLLRLECASDPLLLVGLTGENVDDYQADRAHTPFDFFLSKPLAWPKVLELLAEFEQGSPLSLDATAE